MKLTLLTTKILCMFVLIVRTDNVLDSNLELTTESLDLEIGSHNKVKIYVGSGLKDSEGQETNVEFIFGKSQTILGDAERAKWGVECNKKNSCELEPTPASSDYIFSSQYDYNQGDIYLRLEDIKLDTSKVVPQKLSVQMVSGGNKWPLQDVGIVGLSPQSDFGNYLRVNYDQSTSFIFKYEAKDLGATELSFDLQTLVNPEVNDEDVIYNVELPKEKEHWMVKGNLTLQGTSINYQNVDMCLTNSDDNIIVTSNAFIQCDEIKKVICDGKVGLDCTDSNADYSKAQNIKIKIDTLEVEFEPKEYLYVNKDNKNMIECRIGDPELLRSMELCDPNTEFGLGKMFYSKFYPVLSFNKNGTSSIKILKDFDFPVKKESSSILKYWWILLIILIIIILVFVIMKTRKKNDVEVENENSEILIDS